MEPYLIPEIIDSDIVMTNAKTLSAPAIADHGFGMLLTLTRQLNHFIATRPTEQWERKNFELQELDGKTAVVIGTGGIGSQVARRAKAFGMAVIGVDPKEFPPRLSFDRMVYPDPPGARPRHPHVHQRPGEQEEQDGEGAGSHLIAILCAVGNGAQKRPRRSPRFRPGAYRESRGSWHSLSRCSG